MDKPARRETVMGTLAITSAALIGGIFGVPRSRKLGPSIGVFAPAAWHGSLVVLIARKGAQ